MAARAVSAQRLGAFADRFAGVAGGAPEVFYRGYDVYDSGKVGFISSGPEAERYGFRFDTDKPGNSNAGHEWGTELPAQDKRALIEYLKTL